MQKDRSEIRVWAGFQMQFEMWRKPFKSDVGLFLLAQIGGKVGLETRAAEILFPDTAGFTGGGSPRLPLDFVSESETAVHRGQAEAGDALG